MTASPAIVCEGCSWRDCNKRWRLSRPIRSEALLGWVTQSRIELVAPIAGRTRYDADELPEEVWQGIAASLHERWQATNDAGDKRSFGDSLRAIYVRHFQGAKSLPFIREQVATASDDEKPLYLIELYRALVAQPWSEEIESEAFDMLPKLYSHFPLADRQAAQAGELIGLVDQMLSARASHSEQALQDQGKTNELTRTELQSKRTEALRAARVAISSRLRDLAAKDEGPLRPWLRMEWAYLQIQLEEQMPEVAGILLADPGRGPSRGAPCGRRSCGRKCSPTTGRSATGGRA